jgi:hypothetical protein
MPYTPLPDRRMPYDNDGTLVYFGTANTGATTAASSGQTVEMNDQDFVSVGTVTNDGTNPQFYVWLFYPEQREITATYCRFRHQFGSQDTEQALASVVGSTDTANGMDGTWETASLPAGAPAWPNDFAWRSGIVPVSFTGPKSTARFAWASTGSGSRTGYIRILHVYGEAAAGQLAHDLIYIDHDDTPGTEYTAPEDFGDQPLGTTVVRQFRLKNTSASKTATGINIQLNDQDFAIAESASGPWVQTINLASLGPGAESPTYYVRCTTPAPGAALGPRAARIITVADAGFFG